MLDQGEMYGVDGCSDPKYCRNGQPKPYEELKPKPRTYGNGLIGPPEAPNQPIHNITQGMYVGDNYPKSLLEVQEDIYEGGPVDLLDSQSELAEDRNISSASNVFTSIYYYEYFDGSLDITGVGVMNNSDYRIVVTSVLIEALGKPSSKVFNPGLADDQFYYPSPTRIVSSVSSGLMTIQPNSHHYTQLTPSGNHANRNNHFNPAYFQELTVTVYFRFSPRPQYTWNVFNIIP